MKIKLAIFLLGLLALAGAAYSGSSLDRSDINIYFYNFGWAGLNAGWQIDECLISPTNTLDYPYGSTNRDSVGGPEYLIAPESNINYCEPTNTNQYLTNDNSLTRQADDGTCGELSEFWVTWDTNWFYMALKGEMRNVWNTGNNANQGNNLMILLDRIPNFGMVDFIAQAIWNKGVYCRGFDVDAYIGCYGGYGNYSQKALGGAQLRFCTNYTDPSPGDYQIALRQPADSSFSGKTNDFEIFYNGDFEFNPIERVLLTRIRISLLTNWMPSVSSITLKLMALSVDGSSGAASFVYDFVPNNLAGMNNDRKSVGDNYFLIPFTDASGKVLTNVRPRYDAKVVYLPGSRTFTQPSISNYAVASNTSSSSIFQRKIFVPTKDEVLNLGLIIPKNASLFAGNILIYNLRGEKIYNAVTNTDFKAPGTAPLEQVFSWNGKTLTGQDAPMGTYIVVYTGMTEDGLSWNNKYYVSLVR